MHEDAMKQDARKFKHYQKTLKSIRLDLMQKGLDDFNDKIFNEIETLKDKFSQQEQSKKENLEQLDQVINLFKESIDVVFNSVSSFTLKKYKEENNKGENDEENYKEFEEIKEMILFFRDFQEFSIQCNYNLSRKEIRDNLERIARHDVMLQLDYSLESFYEFKRF